MCNAHVTLACVMQRLFYFVFPLHIYLHYTHITRYTLHITQNNL